MYEYRNMILCALLFHLVSSLFGVCTSLLYVFNTARECVRVCVILQQKSLSLSSIRPPSHETKLFRSWVVCVSTCPYVCFVFRRDCFFYIFIFGVNRASESFWLCRRSSSRRLRRQSIHPLRSQLSKENELSCCGLLVAI